LLTLCIAIQERNRALREEEESFEIDRVDLPVSKRPKTSHCILSDDEANMAGELSDKPFSDEEEHSENDQQHIHSGTMSDPEQEEILDESGTLGQIINDEGEEGEEEEPVVFEDNGVFSKFFL